MTKQKAASDFLLFLRSWAARPLEVAAIAPSSRRLAVAMTTEIGPLSGNVLELGPGTGAFTRALLRNGVYEDNLILVERNPAFAMLLRERFPSATLIEGDAQHLALPAVKSIGAAISGLPLLSMPAQTVRAILASVFHHLAEDGSLFQFTYGPRCPISLQVLRELGLKASFRRWVPLNLPPASVYRISRNSA